MTLYLKAKNLYPALIQTRWHGIQKAVFLLEHGDVI